MENTTPTTEHAVSTTAITEQPSHEATIFAEPIFHIGSFPVTNALLTGWGAVLVIAIISLTLRFSLKKIPGKFQHVFEMLLDGALSLVDQVTNDRKLSERVFPLVFTIFVFILINNWLGILPIVGSLGFIQQEGAHSVFVPLFRAGTADVNTTLALSIAIVIGSNIFGIIVLGLWKVFNKYVNISALGSIFTKVRKDPGILLVAPIMFFVGILELIGEFAKIASLSFRLFGNVFAGEVLLASMAALVAYVVPAPFLFLEVFVGLIQALIFSLLATVYFTIASQDHSEHDEEEHAPSEMAGKHA
jgi:F-type H+-transporting ATPase subunit a